MITKERIIDFCKKHKIILSPDIDQHFIIDEEMTRKIVGFACLGKKDVLLEVGAGFGSLTEEIASKAGKVYSIEIDKKYKPALDKIVRKNKNLKILYKNALRIKFPPFNKIIANIPYNITEPLFIKLMRYKFDLGILTVGKNFTDILKGKKSRLSLILPCYYDIKVLYGISPEIFYPKPKTYSSLIKIIPKKKENLTKKQLLLRYIFEHRYSKTKNALLKVITRQEKTKREARKIISLSKENFLEKIVDNLSNEEFVKLAEILQTIK